MNLKPLAVLRAPLFIAALGLGVCETNGQKVTDEVLTTPFTRCDKRYVYREYDVTDLLCVGKNAIGVHVGNGFYTVKTPSRAEIIFGDNTYKLEVGTYRFKDGQMLSE